MNKEKFKKKCEELIAYEEKCLSDMQKIIIDKNKELNKIGLKCCTYLFWNYFGTNNTIFTRPEFKECYTCELCIIVCKIDEDEYDDELCTVSLIFPITDLRKSLFFGKYIFEKLPTDKIESVFLEYYDSIFTEGYEKTLLKIKR